MNTGRYLHLLIYIRDCIYSIGGNNGCVLNVCERYNIGKNEWSIVSPLKRGRQALGGCSFNSRYIYTICGFDGLKSLSTIEILDTLYPDNHWVILNIHSHPKFTPRFWSGVTQISPSELIIFGGGSQLSFCMNTDAARIDLMDYKLDEKSSFYYPCANFVNTGGIIYCLANKSWIVHTFSLQTRLWARLDDITQLESESGNLTDLSYKQTNCS